MVNKGNIPERDLPSIRRLPLNLLSSAERAH